MKKLTRINVKSKLYKKDLYTTKDYDYLVSKKIIEYDIKDAGFNLTKYFKLLPKDKIAELEMLEKHQRHIQIGKYMRSDPNYSEDLTKSFRLIRRRFFMANEIEDSHILSIKKDAIFVVGKKCKNVEFENVEFVEKNVYTSYHRFGEIECYYNGKTNELDIKGINNDLLYQHKSFMNVLKRIFRLLENNSQADFIKFMKRFVDDYKNKRLNYGYYREFNSYSSYVLLDKKSDDNLKLGNYSVGVMGMDTTLDSELDISYNYIHYILPIIQRFYFKNVRNRR